MKAISRFRVISFFLAAAYWLTACGGALPAAPTSAQEPKAEVQAITFSGVVQAMDGNQWTVGGQSVTLDSQAAMNPNITVGDAVNVQASVSADGSVVVRNVQPSSKDPVRSSADPSLIQAPGSAQKEIVGTVEAITADIITIDGVSYNVADFTEIKGNLVVGDQVKIHMIVNADGSFTIREIERAATISMDDHAGNSNGSHDGPNHDSHSSNSNGSHDGSNHDSHDDHGGSNSGPSGNSN